MACSVYTSWNKKPSVLAEQIEQRYGKETRDRVMNYIYTDQFKAEHGIFESSLTDLPVDVIGKEPTIEWVENHILHNKVNYNLKAVNILQSDEAVKVFEKGEKNKWSLDKILSELKIPKEQKDLIKNMQQKLEELWE